MVCLLAALWVQLSITAGSGWPHNALRHHWLMPISCHLRDCKALLVTSLTHAVLINRLRLGHTRLTHSYLLSRDDQPVCSACQSPVTVKHFLIECVNFAAIHSRYFSASSTKDVFENVNAQSVIDFIKEVYFYQEL